MVEKSERNWLIRTRSMQILGPVSIKKVHELIEKNSLRAEDELSSGNGYWFALRETELLEKYVNNQIPQGFNPITEAKTLLAKSTSKAKPQQPQERREPDEEIAPLSDEDLEYPDMSDMSVGLDDLPDEVPEHAIEEDQEETDDMTLVLGNNVLEGLKAEPKQEEEPEIKVELKEEIEEESIEINDAPSHPEAVEKKPVERSNPAPTQKAKSNPAIKNKTKKSKSHTKTISKNDRYLYVLLFLFIGLIIGVVYYYKTILNKPLPGFETSWIINSAYAQNDILTSAAKKKVL